MDPPNSSSDFAGFARTFGRALGTTKLSASASASAWNEWGMKPLKQVSLELIWNCLMEKILEFYITHIYTVSLCYTVHCLYTVSS